ncbi:flagellin, partial [Candidatus Hakubella thermalkaliphila]
VNALADGRFEVISESGPISFSDRLGASAVRDLGLTQAQSEAAGSGGVTLQIGANRGQSMTFGINDMRAAALGIANVSVSTQAGASGSISSLDGAIRRVSEQRSSLGAAQNRLEHTIRNLDTAKENLQASEARIRDVDMAAEMMEFTKNNILQQAATAMLAQANMAPQAVLQLL